MKISKKLAVIGALGIVLIGVKLYAQAGAGVAPLPPVPPHTPKFGQVLTDLLGKYDVNQDGQLDQTELAAMRKDIEDGTIAPPPSPHMPPGPGHRGPRQLPKEILDNYDVNIDGQLDESERATLHKDIQDGKLAPPHFGPPSHMPGGPAPTAKDILSKYDADQDGRLDESEVAAFLANTKPPRAPHQLGEPRHSIANPGQVQPHSQ